MRIKRYDNLSSKYKILIITRIYHGEFLGRFQPSNLEKYDVEATYVWSPVRYSEWDLPLRFLDTLHFDISKILKKRKEKFNRQIEEYVEYEKPDVIYVVQGIQLFPELIDKFKRNAFVVCSLSDRLSLFPGIEKYLVHYDAVYSYSNPDVEELKKLGIDAVYTPAAADRSVYYPIDCKKVHDLCFVGVMYPERKELLTKLVHDLPDLDIAIFGKYTSRTDLKGNLEWFMDKRLRTTFANREILPGKVNEVYNSSKICLNMNRANAGNSWAGRFACIAASKSFQIMNYNEMADEQFGDCVCLYHDYDELLSSIQYYLEHEDERVSCAEKLYEKYFTDSSLQIDVCQDIIDRCDAAKRNGFHS